MSKNHRLELTDHFSDFAEEQVRSGSFGSVNEVVYAGLRLLEEREARIEALRRALIEGEESGPAGPLDMEEIKRDARARAALAA